MGTGERQRRRGKTRQRRSIASPEPVLVPSPIVVPPDEAVRQAATVIQAYTYQLYQTVAAWLSLQPHQLLHVEFAEDFAISDDDNLELTQVKRTATPLTLRSQAVAALIRATWTFQSANPGRFVVAALITTGKIGKEKNLTFPGKASGLSYWRIAAREHGDVEPIRTALLTLDLPADLKSFLKDSTAEDIRDRIIRPIRWLGSGPSHDEIEHDLLERLVYLGVSQGVGAQDSKNALNALIVELLACVRRPTESRYLTAADLLSVFQRNTYRLLPPSQIIEPAPSGPSGIADTALAIRDAISVPLPPRAALRSDLIENLHRPLVETGILWLHGSSGLGKTTVALLLVRRQATGWTFADLRDLEPRTLRLALSRLSSTFASSGARGVILDDFPADADNSTILEIRRAARAVADADGVMIVTSAKAPSPTLASAFGLMKNSVRAVPYLTERDVGEIVINAKGNPLIWSRVVFVFCGGGHPQLVDARIMGLRQRGWPLEERLADLAPFKGKSNDLEAERQVVRSRLLRELGDQARELLFRLSLLIYNFDRSIMFAVAGVSPAIPQAGILFDALVGPWIEQIGVERYRLSPLLRDSGETGLAQPQQDAIRSAVLEHLIVRRPFPADQLSQFFIFAYKLKNARALKWFSGALVSSATRNRDQFRLLAEELSPFAMADRGEQQLLFSEDVLVSMMLRQAQLRVAIATKDGKRAAKILDRLLFEIDRLSGKKKADSLHLALGTSLMERIIPLAPRRWLEMLKTFASLPTVQVMSGQKPAQVGPYEGLMPSISPDEMAFIVRATALDGIDQLCELIEELNGVHKETRDRYLAATSRHLQSVHYIVSSAWLSAVRENNFDGKAAAAKLANLKETAERWTSSDMAIELACAQAIMLDEYAHDMNDALKVLAEAQAKHPQDYRINRQRQKVYYRNGDHARALAEFEIFADAFPAMSPVDRAFSWREAGRSAAELGERDKTRLFFERAWESARQCSDQLLPMTAGLSGDCAILDFQAGKIDSAIGLMIRALTEAEPIDPKAGLKQHFCLLILMAAILWMRGGAADWPVERNAMVIGMCSNPDPPSEIKDRPLPQSQMPWYLLAELEAETSNKQFALAALRQRTVNGGLMPMETMLASRLLQGAVRTLDVDRFLEGLATYPLAVKIALKIAPRRRPEDFLSMPAGLLGRVGIADWNEETIREAATSAVLGFALAAACSYRNDLFEDLRSRILQTTGLSNALKPLFDVIVAPADEPNDLIAAVAGTLGLMLQPNFVFNASDAFMATVRIAQLLSGHVLGEAVAGPVVRYFSRTWRDIITDRPFSVRGPATNGPLILAAGSKGLSNCAKLANLVLASHAAVRERLPDELREALCQMANPKRTPLDLPEATTTQERVSAA